MGRVSGACKALGMIFRVIFGMIIIPSLLIQGSYAAEVNTSSNDAMNTISDTQTFQWSLLVPIFLGSLLFISWMCRFFNTMSSCFVIFLIIVSGALLFWFGLFDYIRTEINYPFIVLKFLFIAIVTLLGYVFIKMKIEKREIGEFLLPKVRSFIIILAVLIWPSILLYFFMNGIVYVTFYGIEKLKFPVYIISASYIGILSYLLLSIEEIFGHLVPEYQKLRVAWSYLKRILIAPFIAIIGFYLLNSLQNKNGVNEINDYFVFAFAFFAGVFTKTIEEWIYSSVQKLLPADRKDELSNKGIEVKESDFVKKLHFDEDVAYKLYNAKIRKIQAVS